MAEAGLQLISRIIKTGNLQSILDWGIGPEDFLTSNSRGLFKFILEYWSQAETSGSIISEEIVREGFPNFVLCDPENVTTEALCWRVRQKRLSAMARTAAEKMIALAESDPIQAANECHLTATKMLALGSNKQTDLFFSNEIIAQSKGYDLRERGIFPQCCAKWAWNIMDIQTGGIRKDDYICFYGRPKSGKTWCLAYQAAQAYNQGLTPLIYTKEMTPDNVFDRMSACLAGIPYTDYRMGNLTPQHRAQYKDMAAIIRELRESQDIICLSGQDAPNRQDTVAWLRAKAEKYKPGVIFVDGMYLMTDPSWKPSQKDHVRVQNISRAIRQMVLDIQIPVVATIQANRQASGHMRAEFDEIAFSDSIGMDATVAIRVIKEHKKKESDPRTMALVLAGAREFELAGFRVNMMPAVDFSFVRELTEREIRKAKMKDADEDEPQQKRKPSTNKEDQKNIEQQLKGL